MCLCVDLHCCHKNLECYSHPEKGKKNPHKTKVLFHLSFSFLSLTIRESAWKFGIESNFPDVSVVSNVDDEFWKVEETFEWIVQTFWNVREQHIHPKCESYETGHNVAALISRLFCGKLRADWKIAITAGRLSKFFPLHKNAISYGTNLWAKAEILWRQISSSDEDGQVMQTWGAIQAKTSFCNSNIDIAVVFQLLFADRWSEKCRPWVVENWMGTAQRKGWDGKWKT